MKRISIFIIFLFGISYYSFSQCSNPNAGEDFMVCGSVAHLNVTNSTTGCWVAYVDEDQMSPAPIYSPSSYNATTYAVISLYGECFQTVTFVWTDNSGPCTDTVNIFFAKSIEASVGAVNQAEICGNEFTFAADTIAYGWATDMYWSSPLLSVNFDDSELLNASVTIDEIAFGDSALVTAPFVWNMHNYSCHATDTMWVTFYQKPDAYAGLDNGFCGYSGELGAIFDFSEVDNYSPSGWWTVGSSPFPYASVDITSSSSDSSSINVTHTGVYNIIYRENNSLLPSCYSIDTVQIEFVEIRDVNAGEDFDACGTVANLNAVHCNNCSWEDLWFPSWFENSNDSETQVYYTAYGQASFVWQGYSYATTIDLECVGEDEVTVTFYRVPTANITVGSMDTSINGLTFKNLTAQDTEDGIIGYWYSTYPVVEFGNQMSNSTWATVPAYGTYEFYWIEENGPSSNPNFCTDEAGPLTIHFLDQSYAETFDFNANVSIFPNPAKNIITIQSEYEINDVNIYDMNGRIVLKPSVLDSEIDISSLESGVYFVNVHADIINRTFKLVLK